MMDTNTFKELCTVFNSAPTPPPNTATLLTTLLQEAGSHLYYPTLSTSQQQLMIREVLEMAAYWAIHSQDRQAFSRHLTQLMPFYDLHGLEGSPRMLALIGMRLLDLLVLEDRAAFYASISRLTPETLEQPAISFVVQIEQCLAEGTLYKLFGAQEALPVPEYSWFISRLVERVRGKLVESIENVFGEKDGGEHARFCKEDLIELLAATPRDIDQIMAERGWTLKVENDGSQRVVFGASAASSPTNGPIRREDENQVMIRRALSYAKHAEQIV